MLTLLAAILAFAQPPVADGDTGAVAIADFSRGASTFQNGLVFVSGAKPTALTDQLVEIGTPAAPAWRIELSDAAPAEGVAAVLPLFDNRSGTRSRSLFTSGRARTLHVRVLGELGARQVHLDAVAGLGQTARHPGRRLGTLRAGALDGQRWQILTFTLPGEADPESGWGGLQFRFAGNGPAFLAIAAAWLGDGQAPPPGDVPPAHPAQPLRTAMWVWNTREIAPDASRVEALIAFSKRHGVTDLYCQVPYAYEGGAVRLDMPEALGRMNTQASRAALTVHALDGHPQYVRRENHPRMLALVDALARFNASSPEAARFRAVHLDNEPYVLPDWRDVAKRQVILDDYIALNTALSARVRGAGMAFGVDIPFWWDKVDASGQAAFTVMTERGREPLLHALFQQIDNAGIMSYRQRAMGPNGVIGCASGEFELGARYGVAVLAAVETGTGSDVEPGISFGKYPFAYFLGQWDTLKRALATTPGCAGVALHYYRHLRDWEQGSCS